MNRLLIHTLAILVLSFMAVSCSHEDTSVQPSGRTIKLGVIGPFSGEDRQLGKVGLYGVETALALQPMLRNGDTVELVYKDDQSKPGHAVKALESLVLEGVTAVLTLSRSRSVLAMAAVADDHKIPILATLATHPDVTQNSYVSQLSFDDTVQGKVAALYARDELLIDRVAVFSYPDEPHSNHLAKQFIRTFESVGGIITGHIQLGKTNGNEKATLTRLQNFNTELLYAPIRAVDILRYGELIRAMGWSPLSIGSDGLLSEMLLNHSESLRKINGLTALEVLSTDLPLTTYGKKVVKKYSNLFDEVGTTMAVLGVEGMAILLQAFNRCDNPFDSSCVNTKIRSTHRFQGIMGRITIGADGKAVRPVFINAIKGDHLVFKVKVH